jgi:hypothetical protein
MHLKVFTEKSLNNLLSSDQIYKKNKKKQKKTKKNYKKLQKTTKTITGLVFLKTGFFQP